MGFYSVFVVSWKGTKEVLPPPGEVEPPFWEVEPTPWKVVIYDKQIIKLDIHPGFPPSPPFHPLIRFFPHGQKRQ